jgi:hypothetical protein
MPASSKARWTSSNLGRLITASIFFILCSQHYSITTALAFGQTIRLSNCGARRNNHRTKSCKTPDLLFISARIRARFIEFKLRCPGKQAGLNRLWRSEMMND